MVNLRKRSKKCFGESPITWQKLKRHGIRKSNPEQKLFTKFSFQKNSFPIHRPSQAQVHPWDSWLLALFYQSLMIWAERNPGFLQLCAMQRSSSKQVGGMGLAFLGCAPAAPVLKPQPVKQPARSDSSMCTIKPSGKLRRGAPAGEQTWVFYGSIIRISKLLFTAKPMKMRSPTLISPSGSPMTL